MDAQQHWRITDGLQHRLSQLEARVDAMAAQMNAFIAEAQSQLVELLQKQGHDIQVRGTTSNVTEGEQKQ